MNQHTAGPWKLFYWSEAIGVASDRPRLRESMSIATVPRGPETGNADDRALAEANARLIAAAPELLEALLMVRDAELDVRADEGRGNMPNGALAKIEAAIAKAEGR
jgi:hypothetical protein